jgi:hypothetical protein
MIITKVRLKRWSLWREVNLRFNLDEDSTMKVVLDALIEEQDTELEKVEMCYDNLISEAQSNFRNLSLKANPGIQLIEEKFKLDMYTLLNTILLPKKQSVYIT